MSQQIQITGGAKVRALEGVITGTSGVLSSVPLGGANGVATLDSGGKVPVSQLPSSVVTYLGTWNAATNTPTLVNGTGDAGDMYICNVAGTVNFGAGPVVFVVGDWVLYGSGTWQKSSGQNGTVTSVAASITGNAVGLTGSPITTAGTLAFAFAGTNLQYVNGAGNLTTFPTLITSIGLSMPSAFSVANSPLTANGTIAVTGAGTTAQYIRGDGSLATFPTIATEAQRLITEVYNETGATLTKGTVVYINGGHGNLPTITKAIATGDATSAQTYGIVQTDITNNNNGYVVVIGSLTDLDTSAYVEGTQLYLSSTTAGAWTSTKQYAPAHLVYVAIVTRSHPTQGVVEVRIQNGFEMDELHNVSAQSPLNNQGLFYNTSTSLWENKSIATALGYTPANDALVVHNTGNETIGGTKTFSDATKNNGGIFLQNASSNSLAGYMNIGGLTNGVKFTSGGGISNTFTLPSATGYTFTFPNATGTIALTTDLSGYLPLTGGTLTGSLTLPSNTASGNPALYFNYGANAASRSWRLCNDVESFGDFKIQQSTTQTGSTYADILKFTPTGGALFSSSVTLTGVLNGTSATFSGTMVVGGTSTTQQFSVNGTTDTRAEVVSTSNSTAGTFFRVLSSGTKVASSTIRVTNSGILEFYNGGASETISLSIAANNAATFTSSVTATSFVKTSGTSSQYLMADGSVSTLTNPVTGTGTTNYLPKFTGTSTIGNSLVFDNGTNVGINTATPNDYIDGESGMAILRATNGRAVLSLVGTRTDAGETLGRISFTNTNSTNAGSKRLAYISGTRGTTNNSAYLEFAVANDTLGAVAMTLSQTGNLGLGVTPSAWESTTFRGIQIASSNGFIVGRVDGVANQIQVGSNAYYNADGNFKFIQNGYATRYVQNAGTHFWDYSSVSGTAGNNITFTQAMTLTASGRLLINKTNEETYQLDVNGTGRFTSHLRFGTSETYGYLYGPSGQIFGSLGANTTYLNSGTSGLRFNNAADNATLMFMSNTGNVAINFTNPGARFEVQEGTAVPFSGTGYRTAIFSSTTAAASDRPGVTLGYDTTGGGIIATATQAGTTNFLSFWTYNGAWGERLRIAKDGASTFTSSVTATGFFESSDNRLKTLIQDNYQTKGIASITPKLYTKNGKVELGYYAQDFVGILDSAVSKGSDDMLSLSYREVLVAKVYALEQRIKELETKMN